MLRILLLIVALIVYGSLFPWEFHARPGVGNPIPILLAGWPPPDRFAVRDLITNVLLYLPLGAAAFLTLARRMRPAPAVAATVLAGAALSTSIEIAQIFDRGRMPSAFDVVCNTFGTIAGAWLASGFRPQVERALGRRKGAGVAAPGAFALLVIWMGYQLFPLFPSIGIYRLMSRLHRLTAGGWSWTETAFATADWLAAAVLVGAAFGPRLARSRFVILLLAVPLRLLLVGRGPTLNDFLGAGLALVLSFALPRAPAARFRVMAAVLAGALLLRELAPFRFTSHWNRFSWMPFSGVLGGEWPSAAAVLLRKCYVYGAAIWMIRAAGARLRHAAAAVILALAALEIVQARLPGRTPEITDAILAALMTFVLRWLEDDSRAHQSTAQTRIR